MLSSTRSLIALASCLTAVARAQTPRFTAHEIATGLRGGYQVIAADVNHDGKPDLIAVASNLPELVWFENPTWTRHVLASGFTGLINVAAADIDGDGIPEIAVASGFSTRPDQSAGIVSILTHGADVTQPVDRPRDRSRSLGAPAALVHRREWPTVAHQRAARRRDRAAAELRRRHADLRVSRARMETRNDCRW